MLQQPRTGRSSFSSAAALVLGSLLIIGMFLVAACGGDDDESTGDGGGATNGASLSGSINGDGSSTVFPITEAVAEEFGNQHDVDVTVGISGTGGGFEKFCNGETDFSNASRAIKEEEAANCQSNGVAYKEFQVAFDGLSLVANINNDFVDCLTVEELANIWKPDSSVSKWSDVRAGFPDDEISLYGPGTDSGTFDYFTAEIVGEEGASRSDYTSSEDDNQLVTGVENDDNALGYFGFAYYYENQENLKLISVDGGDGCVAPSQETIESGEYAPLSRPLYVYVANDALARPEVKEFMRFFLTDGPALAVEVGYVAAPEAVYQEGLALLP